MKKMIKCIYISQKGRLRKEDIMSENIIANLEEMQVYLRNSIQEILICKHKETDALYLINTFFQTEILENLELEKLKEDIIGIEHIEKTDEGIKIFTRYYFYPTLKDSINEVDKFPLERQVAFTTYVLDKLLKLKQLPIVVLDSLLNSSHLVVDEKGKLQMLGSIIINPDYKNITTQDIFGKIGNIIHIIFSGKEIDDSELESSIPPDIQKIIKNCYDNHYLTYEELVSDFKGSSVYKLMNPESEEGQKIHQIRKNLRNKRRFHSIKKNGLKIIILLIILLPFIAFAGGKLINLVKDKPSENTDVPIVKEDDNKINSNDEQINNEQEDNEQEDNEQNTSTENETNVDEDMENNNINENIEDLYEFYNDELLKLASNENIGTMDDAEQYIGTHSIKVSNQEKNVSTLVGIINLNSDKYSFLKNRKTIDVSMWMKSNKNITAMITLKLIGDDNKIFTQVSNEVNIASQTWSLHSLGINTINGNYIKVYITPKTNENIWIDSIEVEILK